MTSTRSPSRSINRHARSGKPAALQFIPDDRPFDWEAHLFPMLIADGEPVYAQLVDGEVRDLGRADEYERVRADGLERGRA